MDLMIGHYFSYRKQRKKIKEYAKDFIVNIALAVIGCHLCLLHTNKNRIDVFCINSKKNIPESYNSGSKFFKSDGRKAGK